MAANTSQPLDHSVVPHDSVPAVSVPHDIETVFRQKGIPLTRQRAVIWEFFAGADRAATIAEATAALRDQQVAQATVYRAVTMLTELGLLCRVQSREGELCYTAPPIGHSHPLICGVCRRVVRFEGDGDLRELEERLTAETGFSIYGHHLEVYGVCAACREAGRG
jgi:Fur family transcriptional regulator, ferric uptake regulator